LQNAPVEFVSPEAEANYKARIERLRKIYNMEPHDRPLADPFMGANEYVIRRKGIRGTDMIYNHEKLREPLLENFGTSWISSFMSGVVRNCPKI
jgi:hypothetical protein